MSWEFQMRSYLQRSLTAYEKRLSLLLRTAANLNLQLFELNKLRCRVKYAGLIAQKSQRTSQLRKQRTSQLRKMSVEDRPDLRG